MIVRLIALTATFGVLGLLSPTAVVAIAFTAPVALVCTALAYRRVARPWTDLGAWAGLLVALVLAGGPESGSPWTLLVVCAVTLSAAVLVHVPSADVPPTRGLRPSLVLLVVWVVAAAVVSWPHWSLRGAGIGVLDPATTAGTALRAVALLVVAVGAVAAFVTVRSLRRNASLRRPQSL